MDVHARLVAIAAAATSPSGALHSATHAVADALGAESCTIFLRHKTHGLERRTHFGPSDPTVSEVEKTLAERALREVLPVTGDTSGAALLAVPVASINHPIGAIVVRRTSASPFTAQETMRLSGVASGIVELVESVRLHESIEGGDAESEPPPSGGERTLLGVAASPGIAIGVASFRKSFPRALVRRETVARGVAAESARVTDALERTRNDLLHLQSAAASEIGEEQALIFGAHLLLLNDPMLTDLVDQGIARGRSAAVSMEDAFDEITRRLRDVRDPYIQERIEDIEDLRSRVLGHLVGRPREGDIDARIVVSPRTTPSLVVELKARGAVGIASELGGATSHGVLLARALGVPAVTGIEGLMQKVLAEDMLVVDGDRGRVVLRPTAETLMNCERRSQDAERKRTEFLRYRDEPARTADGIRFELQANIALGADLAIARENRAEGIGLYRTEFPFIVRDALPTVEEQVRIYARAYEAFPDAPVTFRLLDLAGDKFVASRELGVSRDAFHGYRSIRILFDYPHILRDQVQAFALAADGRELRVLIPMVTSVEDVVRIKELVAASLAKVKAALGGALVFGAMIETPAAAEIVFELASEVDFFSIGTNDLVQYSLVIDREDPRMASDRHAYHPAILRMIRRAATQAHVAGKRVTVCGEMAARADLAIALLALGIDALSVTPRAIPELKQALARVPLAPLRASVDELLALRTAEEVARALRRYSGEGAAIAGASLARSGEQPEVDTMAPNSRNMNPEDEYFARREGEIERERDRRDAAREELEKREPTPSQPSTAASDDVQGGRASRTVGAMSTAMKALFGIRGNRRRHHA
jgi:phosphotransferase system, enzyme I, PtsP